MTPEQIYELIDLLRTIAEDLAKIRAALARAERRNLPDQN